MYNRYAHQKVNYKETDFFYLFLLNLYDTLSMGTFKINEKIILYRLPETQWCLFETDWDANGAMQWINGSLSL